jgi:hypothetical protein
MVLLLSYQPVYHCPPPPEISLVLERSLAILSLWEMVPFLSEPLKRMNCFAEQGGWFQAGPDNA